MKKLIYVILCFLSFSLLLQAQTEQTLFLEGQHAYRSGDMEKAREKFIGVLNSNPHHKESLRLLAKIDTISDQTDGSYQRQLEKIILPKVNFQNADLQSTLDFLKKEGERLSNHKVVINFVVEARNTSSPVTLSLQNIPFLETLRYIGQQTDVEFAVKEHAIIARPLTTSGNLKSSK